MTGEQAFVFDDLHVFGLRNMIGKGEGRTGEEVQGVLTAEERHIAMGVNRFSGQIVDGRFLRSETIQFGSDGVGNVGVDGPGTAGGSTDEGEEGSWRWIRFARGKNATGVAEDEECVEVEARRCYR
jgi:hypothetical protein